jgi:hypothetical protein
MNGMWQKAADRIRENLGQVSFETWIGPLSGGVGQVVEKQ